jgi:hypothetical protein
MAGWLATFAGSFIARVPVSEHGALLNEVLVEISPTLMKPDGAWYADYVRLRFAADKPAG